MRAKEGTQEFTEVFTTEQWHMVSWQGSQGYTSFVTLQEFFCGSSGGRRCQWRQVAGLLGDIAVCGTIRGQSRGERKGGGESLSENDKANITETAVISD